MCPKAKADQVITHRIEFQETEREALEMVAASITARNVSASAENLTKGFSNLVTPFTQASIAGITFAITVGGMIGIVNEGIKKGVFGTDDSGAPISPEDIPPFIFGIIPGTFAYGIRNINWQDVSNKFDKRMRDYNPPQL